MTLYQLKKRAADRDLLIRKDGQGKFMLVNAYTGYVAVHPAQMSLAEIENWLDDLDEKDKQADLEREPF